MGNFPLKKRLTCAVASFEGPTPRYAKSMQTSILLAPIYCEGGKLKDVEVTASTVSVCQDMEEAVCLDAKSL